jgi:hypothetical protein
LRFGKTGKKRERASRDFAFFKKQKQSTALKDTALKDERRSRAGHSLAPVFRHVCDAATRRGASWWGRSGCATQNETTTRGKETHNLSYFVLPGCCLRFALLNKKNNRSMGEKTRGEGKRRPLPINTHNRGLRPSASDVVSAASPPLHRGRTHTHTHAATLPLSSARVFFSSLFLRVD